jgi:muconolactone D-isomerase
MTTEFLVEFEVTIPPAASKREIEERERAEAVAASGLAADGHLLRLWRTAAVAGHRAAVGIYSADSRAEIEALLQALPLADWMKIAVVPLEPHPNDPAQVR